MGTFYRCPECNSKDFESCESVHADSMAKGKIVQFLCEVMTCNECGYKWEEVYEHSYASDETGKILTP